MKVKVNNAKFEPGLVVVWDAKSAHYSFDPNWENFGGAHIVADGSDAIYSVAETDAIIDAVRRGNLLVVVEEKVVESEPEIAEEETTEEGEVKTTRRKRA